MPVYKDQKRNTWYFDIRYRDSLGKVKSIKRRGFNSKQKAINAERKFLKEMKKDDLPKSRMSLREIGIEMVELSKYDVKEQTYKANLYKVNQFIPDTAIASITLRKALAWRNSLAEIKTPIRHKKDGSTIGGKPYSVKYKNEIIALYKSIFRYAVKMEYIYNDVSINLSPFKKQFEDMTKYNIIDYETFMEAWKKLPERTLVNIYFKLFILLAFSTGARRAELKGLTFKDYDGKGISINKSVTGKNSDRAKIEKTKTAASVRYVELDNFTVTQMNNYIEFIKSKFDVKQSDFIFGIKTPLPNNTIQYAFKRMGLECRLHDLRHSHATLLIQNNVPINIVSKRLGHSTVEMTLKVYTHAFAESQDKAVDVLNKMTSTT
ncbi:site-specific integrase [Erysipelothrix enhydrae]|uniref:tyrosine-type recombinase/integrase n=1 Tax=Erysipelothrix enhydrae TaxID=2890314 RepID=UPI002B242C7D|nr:site-specific integrase [Erysipelothrix sp. 4322-04]WRB86632.1 site-specific integrase [Erysipelothrix sp. 4322-04]